MMPSPAKNHAPRRTLLILPPLYLMQIMQASLPDSLIFAAEYMKSLALQLSNNIDDMLSFAMVYNAYMRTELNILYSGSQENPP